MPGEEELLDGLLDWLRREEGLRGRANRTRVTVPATTMGGVVETLTVAVGGGGALTVLVTSVGAWVRNRRSDVTVEVTVADRTVRVEGKRIKADADSLAALVVEANRAADGH
ncbi:hypothetical protein UO65_1375 [Actinokineospora spheciospongiae]|uniref:Uncharacterized protein n=1 Tax=Actinokineospora spheciospongiae TaxID=909613 RepID=W7J2T0_9PSEU|nr:hypothetical protein UO65_1375 [Actinokineospora spheciospongiae]